MPLPCVSVLSVFPTPPWKLPVQLLLSPTLFLLTRLLHPFPTRLSCPFFTLRVLAEAVGPLACIWEAGGGWPPCCLRLPVPAAGPLVSSCFLRPHSLLITFLLPSRKNMNGLLVWPAGSPWGTALSRTRVARGPSMKSAHT